MPQWLTDNIEWVISPASTLILMVVGIWFIGRIFANQPNLRIYRQLALVGLFILALFVFVSLAPIDDKASIINVLGLAVTAIIGLSSTTFVSNAMAGLMLKFMKSFEIGDFIRVNGFFGGVKSKGLLHTEIQSEDRDIVHLPNLFLITNPVQVVDQDGTLISAEVSIGYNVHRIRVRDCLLAAAENVNLRDPFVHILELGNFAINYRITGILQDEGKLISKQHALKAAVIDALHADDVEIMTPNVMEQRPLDPSQLAKPMRHYAPDDDKNSTRAEQIMFPKSELAARIDRLRNRVVELKQEVDELKQDKPKETSTDGETSNEAEHKLEIAWREHQIKDLQSIIRRFDDE